MAYQQRSGHSQQPPQQQQQHNSQLPPTQQHQQQQQNPFGSSQGALGGGGGRGPMQHSNSATTSFEGSDEFHRDQYSGEDVRERGKTIHHPILDWFCLVHCSSFKLVLLENNHKLGGLCSARAATRSVWSTLGQPCASRARW